MNILVYGAGAVGCMVGGFLAAGGHRVVLLGRPSVMDPIGSTGMTLNWQGRQKRVQPLVSCSLEDALCHASPELIILTVKAFDTETAANDIASAFAGGDAPQVLTLQNGVGNEEVLSRVLGSGRVLSGTTTLAVSMSRPGVVDVHNRSGGMAFAPVTPGDTASLKRLRELVETFKGQGVPTVPLDDYRSLKWSKLLLNMLGNGISAILDMPPGHALADPMVYRLEVLALREALLVMNSYGIPCSDLPGYPVKLLARVIRILPISVSRRILGPRISGGRGDKLPSLLLDLRRGQRRTEIPFLNGAVVEWGRRRGIRCPVNEAVTTVITGISSGSVDWQKFRQNPQALFQYAV